MKSIIVFFGFLHTWLFGTMLNLQGLWPLSPPAAPHSQLVLAYFRRFKEAFELISQTGGRGPADT